MTLLFLLRGKRQGLTLLFQAEREGVIRFQFNYAREGAKNLFKGQGPSEAYSNVSYEKAAYKLQDEVERDLRDIYKGNKTSCPQ